MGFASYTELKDAVASTLNRDEAQLLAAIPDFIALAEARMRRVLKGKDARSRLAISIDTTGEYALPAGTKQVVYLFRTDTLVRGDIEITTPNRMNLIRSQYGPSGVPFAAAVIAGTIFFAPIPDAAYGAELIIDTEISPLSVTTPTNWVLTNYPDLYLYGALVHSAPFIREDARLEMWKSLADQAYGELVQAMHEAEFDGNTPIIRPTSALGE
jgi:hypothetical protein